MGWHDGEGWDVKHHRCNVYGSCFDCGRLCRGVFVAVVHARYPAGIYWLDFDCGCAS